MPTAWCDYDAMVEHLAGMPPEERYKAAMHYAQHILVEHKYDPVPPEVAERQMGVYDQMIRRHTYGSDPLVQEPGPRHG